MPVGTKRVGCLGLLPRSKRCFSKGVYYWCSFPFSFQVSNLHPSCHHNNFHHIMSSDYQERLKRKAFHVVFASLPIWRSDLLASLSHFVIHDDGHCTWRMRLPHCVHAFWSLLSLHCPGSHWLCLENGRGLAPARTNYVPSTKMNW